MKTIFSILMAFMLCFAFSAVNASQTQNKDVGITSVNQVFIPAMSIENTISFEKAIDVKQIYSGGYDTGIGLINSESNDYIQNLASEKQIYQKVYRHGIGKLYATKANYRKNTR